LINIVERYEKLDIGQTFDYASPIYMMDLNFHDLASSMGHLRLDEKTMHEIIIGLDNLSKTRHRYTMLIKMIDSRKLPHLY